jgi:hypothetical protein
MPKPKFKAGQVVVYTGFDPAIPLRIKKVEQIGMGFYCTFYDTPMDLDRAIPEEDLRKLTVKEIQG